MPYYGLKLSLKLPSSGFILLQYGQKGDYRLLVANYWISRRLALVSHPTVIYLYSVKTGEFGLFL
jgi:hypothetical protein